MTIRVARLGALRVCGALTKNFQRPLEIVARVLAAALGGYAVTSLLTIALPLILTLVGCNQAQALLGTATVSFLVWTAIVMAVFHARTASRAWLTLTISGALLFAIILLLLPGRDS